MCSVRNWCKLIWFICFPQVYTEAQGFSCPGVPIVPAVCIFFNIFLFAQVCDKVNGEVHCAAKSSILGTRFPSTDVFVLQLHYEAWVRFMILSILTIGIYALYGQYHADPNSEETIIYHRVPREEVKYQS